MLDSIYVGRDFKKREVLIIILKVLDLGRSYAYLEQF